MCLICVTSSCVHFLIRAVRIFLEMHIYQIYVLNGFQLNFWIQLWLIISLFSASALSWRLQQPQFLAANKIMTTSGGQTLGAWLPRQLNVVQRCLIFSAYYCSPPPPPLHTNRRVISHAQSRKCQIRVRFTGHSRIVGPGYGTSFMTLFWRLEFGGGS